MAQHMKAMTPLLLPRLKAEAVRISALSSKDAGAELKRLLTERGADYVTDLLMILQNCDRKRHGQDDSWWLDMMHDAGPEVEKLF